MSLLWRHIHTKCYPSIRMFKISSSIPKSWARGKGGNSSWRRKRFLWVYANSPCSFFSSEYLRHTTTCQRQHKEHSRLSTPQFIITITILFISSIFFFRDEQVIFSQGLETSLCLDSSYFNFLKTKHVAKIFVFKHYSDRLYMKNLPIYLLYLSILFISLFVFISLNHRVSDK